VKTRDWQGSARLETRAVEQLRADKEVSVLEADKAAAKRAQDAAAPSRGKRKRKTKT